MSTFATTDDIAERWSSYDTDDDDFAANLLQYASDLIRVARPLVESQLATNAALKSVVKNVCIDMVTRALANPDLLTSQGVGSLSQGFITGTGLVKLLPEDLAQIDGSAGTGSRVATSVRARGGCW